MQARRPSPAFAPSTFVVFGVSFVVYLLSSGFKHTAYDGYVAMAAQWLDGHLWIAHPPSALDAIWWNGKNYIIEAPMPGILMLPLVALFGYGANQEFVAVVCASVAVAAAWVVLGRMSASQAVRIAFTAFFALGTAMWWNTAFAALWMFAGVVAAMFAMLALAELYGRRRPWLIGALVMCAALARMPVILALIPLALWLWWDDNAADRATLGPKVRRLLSLLAGVAPLLVVYFFYNYARYGTLTDVGYTVWYHHDQVGSPTGSPFQLQFLPYNLYSYFLLAPEFVRSFPWLHPTGAGVALTFTSPALVLALATAWRSRETWWLWAAVILVAGPTLLYYVNGFEQFGMRHSTDFLAFALPLAARGAERVPRPLWIGLVAVSILANAFGVWYSWAYHGFTVVPQ